MARRVLEEEENVANKVEERKSLALSACLALRDGLRVLFEE